MREDLDHKLVMKFPKIFSNRYGDLRETAMCWGFECGDGWYWLIDELCTSLQWDTDKNKRPQVVASQVKEKYGRLCFYTQGTDDRQQGMISIMEALSTRVCEECGSTEGVRQTETGWVKTICTDCLLRSNKLIPKNKAAR